MSIFARFFDKPFNINHMRKSGIAALMPVLLSVSAAVSCVNEDYDLRKPIDLTIGVTGDISMPLIKNSEFVTVGELLKDTDLGDNIILVPFDRNQDPDAPETRCYYMLSVKGSPDDAFGASFGKLEIDMQEFAFEPFIVNVSMAGKTITAPGLGQQDLAGMSPAKFKEYYDQFGDALILPEAEARIPEGEGMPIEIDTPVPDVIDDISRIEFDADMTLALVIDYGAVTVPKGFRIVFPDYITLEKNSQDRSWTLSEGHIITFSEDTQVKDDALALKIRAINHIPDGSFSGSKGNQVLRITDNVKVEGSVIADLKSFFNETRPVPSKISMSMRIDVGEPEIGNVYVKLDLDAGLGGEGVEDQVIELGQLLPEEISENDITLDLDNPIILLSVVNDSPIAASLRATVDAYNAEDVSVLDQKIILDNKLYIRANTDGGEPVTQVFAVSRKGLGEALEGEFGVSPEDDVLVPEIGTLIQKLPNKIAINNIGFTQADRDEFICVNLNEYKDKELACTCNYELRAPLAFGENLDIRYAFEPIKDLNKNFRPSDGTEDSDLKINLNELHLDFTVANSLPLALGIEVYPIDTDGNRIDSGDLKVDIRFSNAAGIDGILSGRTSGDDTEAQVTDVAIVISPESAAVLERLDGLEIYLTGNAGHAAGTPLNNKQGLKITDAGIRIVGGVEMNNGTVELF